MRARKTALCLLPCIPSSLALTPDQTHRQADPARARLARQGSIRRPDLPRYSNNINDSAWRSLGRGDDDDDVDSRIVGGTNAPPGMFPHQVAILTQDGYFMCGASLIAAQFVLSAAHCDEYAIKAAMNRQYNERGGSSANPNEQIIDICKVERHPSYGTQGSAYDISIYMLCEPVTTLGFEDYVILNDQDVLNGGASLTVTGWGATAEGSGNAHNLQEVEVLYIPNQECSQFYGSGAISNDMMCAGWKEGGKDACQGDSGGPLVIPQQKAEGPNECVQVGVVSWGAGCARREKPGVYAKVSYFKDWITSTITSLSSQNSIAAPQLKFASEKGSFGSGPPAPPSPVAAPLTASPPSPPPSEPASFTSESVSFNPLQFTDSSHTSETESISVVETGAETAPEPEPESSVEIVDSQAFENASSEIYYAPPKSLGCCWYVDYSNVARCSSKTQCNSNKDTCIRDSNCINGGSNRKYYAPGESYEVGTQDPVLSMSGFTDLSGALNGSEGRDDEGAEDLEGLCCWTDIGCAADKSCNVSRQTCHDVCSGQFTDEFGAKNQGQPSEAVAASSEGSAPAVDAVVKEIQAGQTLKTTNGVEYDAMFNMKVPSICEDHASEFYGDNDLARSCEWAIARTDAPGKVQKRCSKYGDLCPVSCGLCT